MPNQERPDNPGRKFRCEDADWLPFKALTAANGTTPSKVLQACVKAYNAEHGVIARDGDVRGCSCGMADYGAPGHDGCPA